MGMHIEGTGNIIRNNQVVNTGGSSINTSAYGILPYGPGSSITNNDIINTVEQTGGYSIGVYAFTCNGCAIENNRISNSAPGPGTSWGVDITSSSNVTAINNRISTVDIGIYYVSPSTGKYRDNLTGADVTTPYSGGTAIGTTNY